MLIKFLNYKIVTYGILFVLLSSTNSVFSVNFQSWGYQLQEYDIAELKNSEYDLIVIDYSKDGSEDQKFSLSEISEIKNGKLDRKVISYISIGEAEQYRYYWDDNWLVNPPSWLGEENPDWKGNYKVKYWMEGWQDIVYGYIQKIIDVNFDGVYLDIIDAYEFYQEEIQNSDELMIDFVDTIANFTRSQNPNFLIIPQNGEQIVNERYLSIVDGIAREEVYVQATNHKRDQDETNEIENYLDLFLNAGKLVLVVDYANKKDLIEYATSSATSKGYISLVTDVDLDYLGPNVSLESDSLYSLFGILGIPAIVLLRRKFN